MCNANEFLALMLSGYSRDYMSNSKNIRVCQVLHGIVGGGVAPLVSIVVPVYNAAQTLEKCVGSLTSQTFGNIEILLVNNGSTDDSLEVCKKIANKDSRIKVIDHYEKGVSTARNRGIDESSGDYIMFVDADDWIDANVCEVFANLNSKYNYDLFCFSAQYHKKKSTIKSFLFAGNVEQFSLVQKKELQIKIFAPQAPGVCYKTETRFLGSVWGKFFRRNVLLNENIQFAKGVIISEDVLFNTLALDFFTNIGYSSDCFYHYELRDDSAQNRYRPNSEKYFLYVIRLIQNWLVQTNKSQDYVDAASCLFVHYVFGVLKEDVFHKDNPFRKQYVCRLNELLNCKEVNRVLKCVNKCYLSVPENILVFLLCKKKFLFIKVIMMIYNFMKV